MVDHIVEILFPVCCAGTGFTFGAICQGTYSRNEYRRRAIRLAARLRRIRSRTVPGPARDGWLSQVAAEEFYHQSPPGVRDQSRPGFPYAYLEEPYPDIPSIFDQKAEG